MEKSTTILLFIFVVVAPGTPLPPCSSQDDATHIAQAVNLASYALSGSLYYNVPEFTPMVITSPDLPGSCSVSHTQVACNFRVAPDIVYVTSNVSQYDGICTSVMIAPLYRHYVPKYELHPDGINTVTLNDRSLSLRRTEPDIVHETVHRTSDDICVKTNTRMMFVIKLESQISGSAVQKIGTSVCFDTIAHEAFTVEIGSKSITVGNGEVCTLTHAHTLIIPPSMLCPYEAAFLQLKGIYHMLCILFAVVVLFLIFILRPVVMLVLLKGVFYTVGMILLGLVFVFTWPISFFAKITPPLWKRFVSVFWFMLPAHIVYPILTELSKIPTDMKNAVEAFDLMDGRRRFAVTPLNTENVNMDILIPSVMGGILLCCLVVVGVMMMRVRRSLRLKKRSVDLEEVPSWAIGENGAYKARETFMPLRDVNSPRFAPDIPQDLAFKKVYPLHTQCMDVIDRMTKSMHELDKTIPYNPPTSIEASPKLSDPVSDTKAWVDSVFERSSLSKKKRKKKSVVVPQIVRSGSFVPTRPGKLNLLNVMIVVFLLVTAASAFTQERVHVNTPVAKLKFSYAKEFEASIEFQNEAGNTTVVTFSFTETHRSIVSGEIDYAVCQSASSIIKMACSPRFQDIPLKFSTQWDQTTQRRSAATTSVKTDNWCSRLFGEYTDSDINMYKAAFFTEPAVVPDGDGTWYELARETQGVGTYPGYFEVSRKGCIAYNYDHRQPWGTFTRYPLIYHHTHNKPSLIYQVEVVAQLGDRVIDSSHAQCDVMQGCVFDILSTSVTLTPATSTFPEETYSLTDPLSNRDHLHSISDVGTSSHFRVPTELAYGDESILFTSPDGTPMQPLGVNDLTLQQYHVPNTVSTSGLTYTGQYYTKGVISSTATPRLNISEFGSHANCNGEYPSQSAIAGHGADGHEFLGQDCIGYWNRFGYLALTKPTKYDLLKLYHDATLFRVNTDTDLVYENYLSLGSISFPKIDHYHVVTDTPAIPLGCSAYAATHGVKGLTSPKISVTCNFSRAGVVHLESPFQIHPTLVSVQQGNFTFLVSVLVPQDKAEVVLKVRTHVLIIHVDTNVTTLQYQDWIQKTQHKHIAAAIAVSTNSNGLFNFSVASSFNLLAGLSAFTSVIFVVILILCCCCRR